MPRVTKGAVPPGYSSDNPGITVKVQRCIEDLFPGQLPPKPLFYQVLVEVEVAGHIRRFDNLLVLVSSEWSPSERGWAFKVTQMLRLTPNRNGSPVLTGVTARAAAERLLPALRQDQWSRLMIQLREAIESEITGNSR